MKRYVLLVSFAALFGGTASATNVYASESALVQFVTDNSYTLTLSQFNPTLFPGATLTGATIYFYASEDLSTISLTNTSSSTQNFNVEITSNIVEHSTNSANSADAYTGEILDLFDTGIGPGQAQQPSTTGAITLGATGLPTCPEGTPSSSCSSVFYTPPDEVVNNTDPVYGFTTGTGLIGLTGVVKNISGADLLNYIGAGTFTLGGSTLGLTTFVGGGNNIDFNDVSNASFQAEIDYTYTLDATTPEPATLGLMGAGLLGIGLASRRKRS